MHFYLTKLNEKHEVTKQPRTIYAPPYRTKYSFTYFGDYIRYLRYIPSYCFHTNRNYFADYCHLFSP